MKPIKTAQEEAIAKYTQKRLSSDKNLFKRYTDQDLVSRAEASIQDIETGQTIRLSDFKAKIESWKQSKDTR